MVFILHLFCYGAHVLLDYHSHRTFVYSLLQLLSENQVDLSSCELFEALSDKKVDLGIDAQDFLPEIREPNRAPTNGKYNLRKSLAWDTAFFTSAGIQ